MLITIITAVKNDKKNILKTINSVKNQNFRDYEHIIIDGNSVDGTSSVIKKNLNKKTFFIKKKDKNLYEALNFGIKIAKGNYICVLHSGDIFKSKNFLSYISKKLHNFDLICGDIVFKKKNKIIRLWNFKINNFNKYNFFKIAHTSLFIKRELKNQNKYNTKYKICSDTDFLIRLALKKKIRFKYINTTFTIMSVGGLSTSFKNLKIKIFEDLNIYLKYFGFLFIFMYIYKLIYKSWKYLLWKLFY